MAGLEVELILRFLAHAAQVRPQGCFSNRLSIVVIVLLPLHERLYIDRRDNLRLMTELPQGPADKVRAEAGFHADHTRGQLLEGLGQRQSLDLAPKNNLAWRFCIALVI